MLAFVESLLTIFFLLPGGAEWLIILMFALPWIIAIIDIATHEFRGNNKLIWLLIVIFGHFIGAIIYFIFGQRQKISNF